MIWESHGSGARVHVPPEAVPGQEPLAPLSPDGRRDRDQGAQAAIAHHWRKRRIASQVELKMRILHGLVAAECPETAVDVA